MIPKYYLNINVNTVFRLEKSFIYMTPNVEITKERIAKLKFFIIINITNK